MRLLAAPPHPFAKQVLPILPGSVADDIRSEHEAAQTSMSDAVSHAMRCGGLLLQAKAALPHGAFGAWLAANVEFSGRTAQAYMRLTKLDDEKRSTAADLSLRKALASILAAKKAKVDHVTVAKVRANAEASGEIHQSKGRVGVALAGGARPRSQVPGYPRLPEHV